ncbi:MAG: antitoxin Xre-like helix-turn-helix domain-containing protein [Gammaproteobacteria bacterium]
MAQRARQATKSPATVLSTAVARAAALLGLNQREAAKVLGLSAATLSRLAAGRYELEPDSKPWELGVQLVRLYRGLDAIMAGDENALKAWMNNENTDLQGAPRELIRETAGLVHTVDYVDGFRARV